MRPSGLEPDPPPVLCLQRYHCEGRRREEEGEGQGEGQGEGEGGSENGVGRRKRERRDGRREEGRDFKIEQLFPKERSVSGLPTRASSQF